MEPTDSTIAKQTEQRKVALVCLARDNAQRDYPARDYISNKNRARRDLRNALSELVFNSQGRKGIYSKENDMSTETDTIAKQTKQRKRTLVCLARDNARRDYPARDTDSSTSQARQDLLNAVLEMEIL